MRIDCGWTRQEDVLRAVGRRRHWRAPEPRDHQIPFALRVVRNAIRLPRDHVVEDLVIVHVAGHPVSVDLSCWGGYRTSRDNKYAEHAGRAHPYRNGVIVVTQHHGDLLESSMAWNIRQTAEEHPYPGRDRG